jgi:hypothetical protein
MTDPSSPMANPGRRLAEARRRRAKLAAADLLSERFSRDSTATWWPTPPKHTDSEVLTYYRRLDLEAADQDEEDADGGIEAPAV